MRARKPCRRLRTSLDGWNVRFTGALHWEVFERGGVNTRWSAARQGVIAALPHTRARAMRGHDGEMSESKNESGAGRGRFAFVRAFGRAALLSLPGRLLLFIIVYVMLAQMVIFLPLASAFRSSWMVERIQAAHIAALSADVAMTGALGEVEVRDLLSGADAVAVARVIDGRNELVLYGGPIAGTLVSVDRGELNWLDDIVQTAGTFVAPEGRYLRIVDSPMSRPDVILDVIVPEAPLKRELLNYSAGLFWLSAFIAVVTGALIYVTLFYMFVRPMRRLSAEMARFQRDPENPAKAIRPSGRRDEIGQAEIALSAMQDDIRQAFKQRERLAALGAAIAKINHDLRNVLSSAQLVSDSLATSEDERVRRQGSRLVRAIGRGIRLCEETLKFGRSEEAPPVPQAVDIHAAVEEAAADAFLSEGQADWTNTLPAGLTVTADPDHVHRIFLNLFRNALQAMGEDGCCLTVSLAEGEAEDGAVTILVADTGAGIPEKVRGKLFQPFSGTSRKDGTGLGLSTARELARANGGDLELVSTGPDGTVFAVRLGV